MSVSGPTNEIRTSEDRGSPTGRDSIRRNIPLLAIIGAVVIVRLFILAHMHSEDPRRFVDIDPDSQKYERLAISILDDGEFALADGASKRPEFLRTPGYPAFIAAVYGVFGRHPAAVIVVQVLLSGLLLAVVYRITAMLFSPRAGLYAAAIAALDPLHTDLALILMSDSLGALLTVVACFFGLLFLTKNRSPWIALAFGAALALSTMIRPISYYLTLVIVVGLIVSHRAMQLNPRQLATAIVAFLIPSLLLVGGWQVRNHQVVGSSTFSGITGRNMLNYRAAAVYALRHDVSRKDAAAILNEQMRRESDTTKHVHERQMSYGLKYLFDNPAGTAHMTVLGGARLMLDPGGGEILKLFGVEPQGTGMTNSMSASFGRYLERWSGGNTWAAALIVATVLYLGALYVLTLLGLVRWAGGPRNLLLGHALILGMTVYFIGVSAGSEGLARLRAPFAPLMTIYAGAALAWIHLLVVRHRVRRRSRHEADLEAAPI